MAVRWSVLHWHQHQFTFNPLRVWLSISNSISHQIELECGFSSLVLSEKLFLCRQVIEGFVRHYDGDQRGFYQALSWKGIQTEAHFLSGNSQSGCSYTMQCKSRKILHRFTRLTLCAHVYVDLQKEIKMSKRVFCRFDTAQGSVWLSQSVIFVRLYRLLCVCFPFLTLTHECNNHWSQSRLAQKNLYKIYVLCRKITKERRIHYLN